MDVFITAVLDAVSPYLPHAMFRAFGPLAEKICVGAHLVMMYAYLMGVVWYAFRWGFGGRVSIWNLSLCVIGSALSLAGPLMSLSLEKETLALWEGAWHMAVLMPVFMMLSRVRRAPADDDAAIPTEESPAVNVSDREKWMSMLGQTSDGILTVNRQGIVEMVNAAAEKILGVSHKDLVGRPLKMLADMVKFYTDDNRPLSLEDWAVARALREGTIANEQSVQLFPFKSKGIFLRISASPLRDAQGKVQTVICVMKDRTAHRQLEILKEEIFKPAAAGQPFEAAGRPAEPWAAPQQQPAARAAAAEMVSGGPLNLSQLLKQFLWEQSGEATRMGVTFLDQIPSVLPSTAMPAQALKRALAGIMTYALNTTASGGMVRLWASLKDGQVVVAIRDGGMGMIPDEVTRFQDQVENLSTAKGEQQRNPLYPLIVAKEELSALGLRLQIRSDGLKKGTEYYFLLPAGVSATPRFPGGM